MLCKLISTPDLSSLPCIQAAAQHSPIALIGLYAAIIIAAAIFATIAARYL